MGDPTFAHQFSMATQADILRQAARDQQRCQARLPGGERGTGRWVQLARRLALVLWRHGQRANPLKMPAELLED